MTGSKSAMITGESKTGGYSRAIKVMINFVTDTGTMMIGETKSSIANCSSKAW